MSEEVGPEIYNENIEFLQSLLRLNNPYKFSEIKKNTALLVPHEFSYKNLWSQSIYVN